MSALHVDCCENAYGLRCGATVDVAPEFLALRIEHGAAPISLPDQSLTRFDSGPRPYDDKQVTKRNLQLDSQSSRSDTLQRVLPPK